MQVHPCCASRRMLAEQSRRLLDAYRRGREVGASGCPLQRALRPDANGSPPAQEAG